MKRSEAVDQMNLLKRQFLVERIMIRKDKLIRASTELQAQRFYSKYDIVPYPQKGPVSGFYKKTDPGQHDLAKSDLIGGGTGILDLIGLFAEQDYFFILHANTVAGFVHYSDLNHPNVRVPLYGMMQIVEAISWDSVSKAICDNDVKKAVTRSFKPLLDKKEKNEKNNIANGWVGILNLPEILRLARGLSKNDISDEQIEKVRIIRNRLAHPHGNLIDKKEDIRKLMDAQEVCRLIIESA